MSSVSSMLSSLDMVCYVCGATHRGQLEGVVRPSGDGLDGESEREQEGIRRSRGTAHREGRGVWCTSFDTDQRQTSHDCLSRLVDHIARLGLASMVLTGKGQILCSRMMNQIVDLYDTPTIITGDDCTVPHDTEFEITRVVPYPFRSLLLATVPISGTTTHRCE